MKKIIRVPADVVDLFVGRVMLANASLKITMESSENQVKSFSVNSDASGMFKISFDVLPLVGWYSREIDFYILRVYDINNNPLTVTEIADSAIMGDEFYLYASDITTGNDAADAIFREWVGCKPVISSGVSPIFIPTPRIEITGGASLDGNATYQHTYQINVFWADCQDKRFLQYNPEIWEFRHKTKHTSKKKNPLGQKLRVLVPNKWAHTYHLANVGGMRQRRTEFPLKKLNGAYVLPEQDVYRDIAHNYTERKLYRNNAVSITPNFNSFFNYNPDDILVPPLPRGQHRRSSGISGRFNEYLKYAIVIKVGDKYYMSELSSETVQLGHNRVFSAGTLVRADMPICRFGR